MISFSMISTTITLCECSFKELDYWMNAYPVVYNVHRVYTLLVVGVSDIGVYLMHANR